MKANCRVQLACKHDIKMRQSARAHVKARGRKAQALVQGARDLLRASMMPPENTRAKMDSTPTVEAMMGSRPTAAQPLNKALEAMLVRNKTSQYVQNLQQHSVGCCCHRYHYTDQPVHCWFGCSDVLGVSIEVLGVKTCLVGG